MSEYWDDSDLSLDQYPEEFYGDEGFGGEGDLAQEAGSEELWLYQTAMDERVCGQCAPLEGVLFNADDIAEQFPQAENYEDIIFANVHDRCRCQLIRQQAPQEPGGEEPTVDGRGTPLRGIVGRGTHAPSLMGLIRHPTQMGAARFGVTNILLMLGLGALLFPIVGLLLPMIQAGIQRQVQEQIATEVRKQIGEQEQKRRDLFRETFRSSYPE